MSRRRSSSAPGRIPTRQIASIRLAASFTTTSTARTRDMNTLQRIADELEPHVFGDLSEISTTAARVREGNDLNQRLAIARARTREGRRTPAESRPAKPPDDRLPLPPHLKKLCYLTMRAGDDIDQEAAEAPNNNAAAKAVGLALAMATHPRLGASSPLSVLSEDLLRRIWTTWVLSHSEWLAAVCCRADWCVRGLDFIYVTKGCGPSRTRTLHGCDDKGTQQEPFLLEPGEHIVMARGYYAGGSNARNVILNQLQLVTSRGRYSPCWGQEGGRAFELIPRLPEVKDDKSAVDVTDKTGSPFTGARLPGTPFSVSYPDRPAPPANYTCGPSSSSSPALQSAHEYTHGLHDWLVSMRMVGSREDRMDMDDVNIDVSRRTVEHRSRGAMLVPTRPLTLLNAQRAMLTSIEITGGPSNRVAEMTGAVGHIVGVGARAPPLSWEAELSELLASDFAVAHRRAMGEEENLAEKLLAMVLGRRR